MDIKDFKISAITEISKAVVSNLPPKKLVLLLQFYLKNRLKINQAKLINLLPNGGEITFEYGFNPETVFPNKASIINLKNTTDGLKKYPNFEAIIPIHTNNQIGAYLILNHQIANNNDVSPVIKNLSFIETITHIVLVAIENQILQKQQLENEILNRELKLAVEIQKLLIPQKTKETPFFKVTSVYLPLHGVGGDYFDFVPFSDTSFFFCMADISGKGISAALVMAHFQAHVKLLVQPKLKLKNLVTLLNEFMFEFTKGEYFVTFFGAMVELKTSKLTYVNAAHFPVFIKKQHHVLELKSQTSGLGMNDELIDFKPKTVNLKNAEAIIAYTDGVLDVFDKNQNHLGSGFKKMVLQTSVNIQENYSEKLLEKVKNYAQNGGKEDDLTILSILLKQAFLSDKPL